MPPELVEMAATTPVLDPGLDLVPPNAPVKGFACVVALHVELQTPCNTSRMLVTVSCGYQTFAAFTVLPAGRGSTCTINEGCALVLKAGSSQPLGLLIQLYNASGQLLGRARFAVPDEATACLSTEPNPLHTAPHVQQTMSTADDHSPLLSTTSMDAALSDAEFWGLRIGTVRLLAMAFSQSSSSPPDLPPGTKPMQGPFLTAQAAVRHMLSSSGTTAAVLAACVPCLPSSDRIGQPGVLPPVGTPGSKDQPVMVFNRQLGVLEEEFMPPRLLPAMRFMYSNPLGRGLFRLLQGDAILTRMTLSKGLQMDSPRSAPDIPGFLGTFHGQLNLSEVALPSQPTISNKLGSCSKAAAASQFQGSTLNSAAQDVIIPSNDTTLSSGSALTAARHSSSSPELPDPQPATGSLSATELARAFPTFNHFFFRGLRPGSRPVAAAQDPRVAVSAADCRLIAYESVQEAMQVWVKGRAFRLPELLGGDRQYASLFAGGPLLVFRLCPQDYHRFHSPVDGTIEEIVEIPGAYLTVNPVAVTEPSSDPLGCNRRAVAKIRSDSFGQVAFVPVGATFVGSIKWSVQPGQRVTKGQELGMFAFGGSTVVVLFELGRIQLDEDLLIRSKQRRVETLVRMGERIGCAV